MFKKRTASFLKQEIQPIWIFGGNRLSRQTRNRYFFSNMEWSSLKLRNQQEFYTSYYCPLYKHFLFLHNVLSISSTTASADLSISSIIKLQFSQLLTKELSPKANGLMEWLVLKRQWRCSAYPFSTKIQKQFRDLSVSNQTSPVLFPVEAGWPSPHHQWIETPTYIWQSYLLYFLRSDVPCDVPFTFHNIFPYFKQLTKREFIQCRDFSFINGHY